MIYPPVNLIGSIYLMRFETSAHMAKTLLRFQEHYESPKFRGEYFTLDEFQKWRVSKTGEFTYYTDWTGFNFPSWVLQPFKDCKFEPMDPQEELVVAMARNMPEPFYLIAVANHRTHPDGRQERVTTQTSALAHEIAHGLWSTNSEYRAECLQLMMAYNLTPFFRWISSRMYHPATWLDEAHAYLSQDYDWLIEKGAKVEDLASLSRMLKDTFNTYTHSRFIDAV